MFSVVSVNLFRGPHAGPRTLLTVLGPILVQVPQPGLTVPQLVHYEARTIDERTVGIRLKCLLVNFNLLLS